MRRKKKKGETAVEPQIHPRVMIPKLKRFASPNFRQFFVGWATEHEPCPVLLGCAHRPKLKLCFPPASKFAS